MNLYSNTVFSRELMSAAAKSDSSGNDKWLPFYIHAIDTAGIMVRLITKWIPIATKNLLQKSIICRNPADYSEDNVVNICVLVALLHDIGKLTPAFQSKIARSVDGLAELLEKLGLPVYETAKSNASPHDLAGQVILDNLGFPKEIFVIIGSHHGKPHNNHKKLIYKHFKNYFGENQEKEWRSLWKEWIEYALNATDYGSIEDLPVPNNKAQMIIAGLLIMSDWIASNTKYFPLIEKGDIPDSNKLKFRLNDAWHTLNLPVWADTNKNFTRFEDRFIFPPNEFQSAVIETALSTASHGIYILEAPMGHGKTEAALACAEIAANRTGAGGIYFGLPTQATANGIFGRIKKWAEQQGEYHSVRLAHGMIDLNEEYQSIFHGTAPNSNDECIIVHEWFEGRKQALLSDYVIATVDQLLLASLKQKHVMLRHLGLAGKIVIIDECHAYDEYMNVYLDSTLRWLGEYHVPVIILSATLPNQRRNELIKAYTGRNDDIISTDEYPMITWSDNNEIKQKSVRMNGSSRKISVDYINDSEIVSILETKLSDGGCAGVIVNTVEYSQRLAERLRTEMHGYEVICFHSGFISTDRAKIEKNIISRINIDSKPADRNKLIVVGTQVLEQSLDIDFDYMITEICPMELLLQRSGRLHRHSRIRPEKLEDAVLSIMYPDDEKYHNFTLAIYSKWLIERTEKYLPDCLNMPECIPVLVRQVNDAPDESEENSPEWNEYLKQKNEKHQKASAYCIDRESIHDNISINRLIDDNVGSGEEADASVRDTDETIEVLVLRKISDSEYTFMNADSGITLNKAFTPSDEEARLIAGQRLRLPSYFSRKFRKTINELKKNMPAMWQTSGWLKGEVMLFFDENSQAVLQGVKLYYDSYTGLSKKE